MEGPRPIALAAAGSTLVHLLLVALVALQIVLGPDLDRALLRPSRPRPAEVTIEMPEILRPPSPPERPAGPEAPPSASDAGKGRRTYIRTTHNDPEESAPATARFESDRNTTAASEADPTGAPDDPLPSQTGPDVPFLDFIDREYVDGALADDDTRGERGPEAVTDPSEAAAAVLPTTPELEAEPDPQPADTGVPDGTDGAVEEPLERPESGSSLLARTSPPPAAPPTISFPADDDEPLTVEDARIPERPEDPEPDRAIRNPGEVSMEEVAALVRGQDADIEEDLPHPRNPSARRPATARPRTGDPNVSEDRVFQPHNRVTHYEGGIGRRGRSAVDAADTPLGRYGKSVTQAISRKWHRYRLDKSDFLDYATIKLQFQIDAAGRVQNLRIVSNDANAIMTDFTLSAILDAEIPAIPPDVIGLLDDGRFNMTYHVIVY